MTGCWTCGWRTRRWAAGISCCGRAATLPNRSPPIRTPPTRPPRTDADGGESALTFWKRRVAENCLYGVDRNGMAVELAKLALWLETVAADRPLTFLDHRLRCGDSVVGARLDRLDAPPRKPKKGERTLAGMFAPAERRLPADARPRLAAIRAEPSDTLDAVKAKGSAAAGVRAGAGAVSEAGRSVVRGVLPTGPGEPRPRRLPAARHRRRPPPQVPRRVDRPPRARATGTANRAKPRMTPPNCGPPPRWRRADAEDQRPFHWELEFPAVYFAAPPDDPKR